MGTYFYLHLIFERRVFDENLTRVVIFGWRNKLLPQSSFHIILIRKGSVQHLALINPKYSLDTFAKVDLKLFRSVTEHYKLFHLFPTYPPSYYGKSYNSATFLAEI